MPIDNERTVFIPNTVKAISGMEIHEGQAITNVVELENTYRGNYYCYGCTWLVEILKEYCIETQRGE